MEAQATTLKPSEVLARAADLIEPEGRWTTGEYARDKNGSPRTWEDFDATCFCARGAIYRVAGHGTATGAQAALRRVLECGIINFNDAPERTQAEVVAALRAAAELAKAEGQ